MRTDANTKWLLWVTLVVVPICVGRQQIHQSAKSTPKTNYGTLGFDDDRFFSGLSGENWAKINAAGKRSFIAGINPQRSALVIVDLQESCIHWGAELGTYDRKVGEAFTKRMTEVALPNVQRLLTFFRRRDMLVIYTMLETGDRIPELIAPSRERMERKREFVLNKFSAGAFSTSAIDNVLRENGIATILVTGTDTAGCVLATLTGANDRTYQTILVEDACVSSRTDLHEAVVKIWKCFGFVRTTDQVVNDFP